MRTLFKLVIGLELLLVLAALLPAAAQYRESGTADWENLWFAAFVLLFAGLHVALYPVEVPDGEGGTHPLERRWGHRMWRLFMVILVFELLVAALAAGIGISAVWDADDWVGYEALKLFTFAAGFAGIQLALLVRPAAPREEG